MIMIFIVQKKKLIRPLKIKPFTTFRLLFSNTRCIQRVSSLLFSMCKIRMGPKTGGFVENTINVSLDSEFRMTCV